MSAVTSSLARLENEHEEILNELHEISRKPSLDDGDLSILEDLKEIVTDWDQIFGGDLATETIGKKVEEVENSFDKIEKIKQLDWLVDPLRHYVIGLEKFQREENRETVTRAGMAIERIVTEIGLELGMTVETGHMESAFGDIQSPLDTSGVHRAQIFVSDMRSVYTLRNDRGPHDVPAAEFFQAKRAISEINWIYYRYLQIISEIGSTSLSNEEIEAFTNLIDVLLPLSPNLMMGEGGGEPSLEDILVQDLFKSGFFRKPRTLGDVREKLESKRRHPNTSTLSNNLSRLKGEVLTRKGSTGSYQYVEKIPPGEYFD
jgi:hypothetical protein